MIDKIKLKEFILYYISKHNSKKSCHVVYECTKEMIEKIEKDDCEIFVEDDIIIVSVDGIKIKMKMFEYIKWLNNNNKL
jgi:hydrogenase maturation factor HypE